MQLSGAPSAASQLGDLHAGPLHLCVHPCDHSEAQGVCNNLCTCPCISSRADRCLLTLNISELAGAACRCNDCLAMLARFLVMLPSQAAGAEQIPMCAADSSLASIRRG